MEEEIGTWDSVLLEDLSEDSFISNLHQRYKSDCIYTYIGTSVVAVNPFKILSLRSQELVNAYGSKGIFQLPPHIFGLANLAFQSLKDQSEDQCIVLSGESGSGKTESFKMVLHFLTQIQNAKSQLLSKQQNCNAPLIANLRPSSHPNSRPSTPKHHSFNFSPGYLMKTRSESSDRANSQRKASKEKVVDFDFSHHKSSENLCQQFSIQTAPKSCFKHNHVDIIERSNTLTNVNYCERKTNCDIKRDISTNKLIESPLISSNINKCCINNVNKSVQHDMKTYQGQVQSPYQSRSTPLQEMLTHKHCNHVICKKQKSLEISDCPAVHCNSPVAPVTRAKSEIISCYGCNSSPTNFEFIQRYSRTFAPDNLQKGSIRTEKEKANDSSVENVNIKLKKIKDRIACCETFLDAMGNATTSKNFNSSRYGKFIDMEIDYKGEPIGVHIIHYMLEKTRVTQINPGERNFHIFYQLLAGADIQFLKTLKLYRNIERYELLKGTGATEEDKVSFAYTKRSLEMLGLSSEEIISIFKIIAVVLKLGNFVFVPVTNIDGTEGCKISNDYELQETAQLLKLDGQVILHCLTRAGSLWVNDDNGSELDARQASSIRSILCRTLYGRLFTWMINRINELLKSNQREKNLALLDFYGFENLENNSFEQLAINYCNEKLHQNFMKTVLKNEQELYIKEGLEWSKIDFFDNASICELIDKPNYGILSILNEPHINSDESLLVRMQQCCAGHPNFLSSCSTMTSMCFKIRHYANVVTYSVQGFLEKNSDSLPKNISSALYHSKLSLVQSLFPEGNPKRSSKKPTSLSSNLRIQLQTLLSIVKNRRNHYVFCIKPNESRQPRSFDLALVQHQVRYLSLMPLVHLCRTGHCFHITHIKFFNRYKLLNTLTWPNFTRGSIIEGLALIIRSVPLPSAEFTIGTKHVFIRSPRTIYELEEFRKARLDDLAILIQKQFRMYVKRKKFLQLKQSQIVISSAWRTWRAREEYRAIKYKKQLEWAVRVIQDQYRKYKMRQFLLTLPLRLPPNTMSPLSLEWPNTPKYLIEASNLLRCIYHRWRCYIYRRSFDQTSRNRMREKVTASIIFKDRKASYSRSVSHPFIGDYVRLRHNLQWKKYSNESNDQYVVFADIINKITRTSGKFVPILLVLSTSSMLLLDQRTLQIKYRVPAAEIYRLSLSPYTDDIAVFHVKASEFGRKKGDFVFQTAHVIEIVTKLFLVIQNATTKPPEVHISTEFEANFGQQTVIFTFKYAGVTELTQGPPKVTRRSNRMEIIV